MVQIIDPGPGGDLARLLASYETRLRALERTAQAAHSSIEGGSMEIYDETGALRGSVGVQPDGGVALVPVNTPPPPTPTPPAVEPVLAGLVVGWDGQWDDSYETPSDFALVQVHRGPAADFIPDLTTHTATITAPRGGNVTVAVEGYTPVWVRLVAANTAAVTGPPSAAVQGTPRQAVGGDLINGIVTETKIAEQAVSAAKIRLGSVGADQLALGAGNLVPDPSFETAQTVQLIADHPSWTLDQPGNGSPTALSVDATGAAKDWKSLRLTYLRVLPGERHFLACDFRVSAAFNGVPKMYLCYEDDAGRILGYGVTEIAVPLAGPWVRATAQVQAPQGTVGAALYVQAAEVSAGRAWFDNAEARTVVSAGMVVAGSISATELAASSVTAEKITALAVTAEKIAALSVTSDKVAALAITSDKLAVNSVTAGKIAVGAVDASHIRAGAIDADRLAIGADGNLIADPGFEGTLSDQRVAGSAYWSLATPGNGSPRALQVSAANMAPTSRAMTLATLSAVPGAKVWLTIDYRVSDDWDGARVSFFAQWLDAQGNGLGYSTVTTGSAVVRGAWATMSGVPDSAAPTGTVRMRVACSSVDATAGTVQYDNAACRIVMASGVAGARTELSPQGLRLYDDSGSEAVALVTGQPNYLTLSTDNVPVATIDQEGAAGFQTLSVVDTFSVQGSDWKDHLAQFARGIVAIDYQASTVSNVSGAEMGFVELAFTAEAGRMYRTTLTCYADPSTAGGEVQLILRDGGTKAPLITSEQVQSAIYPLPGSGYQRVHLDDVRSGESWGLGQHRLLVSFKTAGGPAGQTVRLFGGSNHHGLFYVEDVGPYVPETGAYNTGGGTTTPPVQKYTKTYAASWSGSYANRSSYNSYYGNRCVQGHYSSTNGTQAALIGFPSALTSDLAGAKIIKAEIFLYFEHWYSNAGGKCVLKAHKHASRPTAFSCDSEAQTISWKRNEGKWVDVTAVFDSTSWRGFALDPNSTSSAFYGIARGVGQANAPMLRIAFTK
ncbi:hypothetical protein ACWD4V_00795 [Streptomyces tsukubensis]